MAELLRLPEADLASDLSITLGNADASCLQLLSSRHFRNVR